MNHDVRDRPPARAVARDWRGQSAVLVLLRGFAGAAVGGVVGYCLFRFLLARGFYALVLPGALLGLGAGLAARGRSLPLGIACGVAALGLSIYAEWVRAPFKADASLAYFLMHLHRLDGGLITHVMMGLGASCAFWFGQGR